MKPYDLHLLRGIRNNVNSPRLILHLHGGEKTYFQEVLEYQPDGISWQDQLTSPSIVEARNLYNGVLMGGIDHTAINYLPFSKLKDQIISAKKQSGNRRFILAPGCVIPSHCPKRVIEFASEIAQAVD
jgi:uroporphyrinogen decarboxylase